MLMDVQKQMKKMITGTWLYWATFFDHKKTCGLQGGHQILSKNPGMSWSKGT